MLVSGTRERGGGSIDQSQAAVESAAQSTFPRARRLLTPSQFSSVLAAPIALRAGAFALHVAVRSEPGTAADTAPAWRLGLVIPKRFVASAVRRNAIKRSWREAFRLRAASLEARLPACDLVVRMSAPLYASKRGTSKRADATNEKGRRQAQQGNAKPHANQAIDAMRMIDQMDAGLSAKALARRAAAGSPAR